MALRSKQYRDFLWNISCSLPLPAMRTLSRPATLGSCDERVMALNYATLAVVDEILWLPSPTVAAAAVGLLYGTAAALPDALLAHVGGGIAISPLVVGSVPLAQPLRDRLGRAGLWRAGACDPKHVRALARQRYRDLQGSLMRGSSLSPSCSDSLVRATYGGRAGCAEGARRLLARVAALNHAALALLTHRGPDVTTPLFDDLPALPDRLPDRVLGILAEALPPIVVPDFQRLAGYRMQRGGRLLAGEESTERYRSLFAELLSFAAYEGEARS